MDINAALSPLRPFLQMAGAILIIVGLLKFFGVNINVLSGSGLELGVAGYLMKSI